MARAASKGAKPRARVPAQPRPLLWSPRLHRPRRWVTVDEAHCGRAPPRLLEHASRHNDLLLPELPTWLAYRPPGRGGGVDAATFCMAPRPQLTRGAG